MSQQSNGKLILVLHHHLPYIRHPEYEDFMEEDWLHQAVVETYLPLLGVFERIRDEGIPYRMTVSLTPPLISMLDDPLLRDRTERHLTRMLRLAESEVTRTKDSIGHQRLALYYRELMVEMMDRYKGTYGRDIVSRYRELQDSGHLEIITCCATHGFLPLMNSHTPAMRAQIDVACDHYRQRFGRNPRGIWLAECGYQPGVETLLEEQGIEYFFVDTHSMAFADPRPRYGVFAPVVAGDSNVAAFGRDLETSHQVWSSETGYPGDAVYREFYRDLGWDLDLDYLRPFLGHHGFRKFTGFKYHRVTGKVELHEKELYDPREADRKADDHAANFLFNREQQIEHLSEKMDTDPVVVAPYDAELFGHWWYEGPNFLNYLIRKTACDSAGVKLATAGDVLDEDPAIQKATPSYSSWGYKGYCEFWLNGENDWLYRHLHHIQEEMSRLADQYREEADPLRQRVLNQAARELLLAQSSDWAFIMKTGTVVDYAVKRSKEHIDRFLSLAAMCRQDDIDEGRLAELESRDNIFMDIDFRVYCSRPGDLLAKGVVNTPTGK
jgi:1,4-alpha-glucan branching enzyme